MILFWYCSIDRGRRTSCFFLESEYSTWRCFACTPVSKWDQLATNVRTIILTPPAQAADITGLLSYLRPFGIVPLPPFPSKIFAPLSLLRSSPLSPLRPFLIFPFSSLRCFPLLPVEILSPLSPLRPFPPEISLFLPKIFSHLSLLRSSPLSPLRPFPTLSSSPFSSQRSFPPFPPEGLFPP